MSTIKPHLKGHELIRILSIVFIYCLASLFEALGVRKYLHPSLFDMSQSRDNLATFLKLDCIGHAFEVVVDIHVFKKLFLRLGWSVIVLWDVFNPAWLVFYLVADHDVLLLLCLFFGEVCALFHQSFARVSNLLILICSWADANRLAVQVTKITFVFAKTNLTPEI